MLVHVINSRLKCSDTHHLFTFAHKVRRKKSQLKRRRVIFSVLDEAHEDESCEHAGACDQLEAEVQRSIKR